MTLYATTYLLIVTTWAYIFYQAWINKSKSCTALICVWLSLQMADYLYKDRASLMAEFIESPNQRSE